MDGVFGPWFGQLVAQSAAPRLTQRFLKTFGALPSGRGFVRVSALAASGVQMAAAGNAAIEPWLQGAQSVAHLAEALQLEHPALRELGQVDPTQYRTYAALTRIARHASIHPVVHRALGCLVLEAAWDARELEGQWVEMLATLSGADQRAHTDPAWWRLRELKVFDAATIDAALEDDQISGQAARLAQRLARALRRLTAPAPVPIEQSSDAAPDEAKDAGGPPVPAREPGDQEAPKKRKGKNQVQQPPSFARLTSSAKFCSALDVMGVSEVWHRYRLSELAPVTRRLAEDLALMGTDDVPAYAACCITALLVNHDHRATLELSLTANNDLWLSIQEGVLVVVARGRRQKHPRPEPASSLGNRFYIAIPQALANYLAARVRMRPTARTLRELLGVELVDAWLSACEAYLASLGEPAHPSRSARVSHSLGYAYLECGASSELAAAIGVAPALCADSSLHYLCIPYSEARTCTSKVYEVLGLGAPAETADYGRMGSTRALPDEQVREVWRALSDNHLADRAAVRNASTLSEVAGAYTRGSAAGFLAESWCTAARGQRADQPTHRDLRSHATLVYRDDKETHPESSRLVPRLSLLDQVIRAHLELSRATADRLRELGVAPDRVPTALRNPRGRDPFFGRLEIHAAGTPEARVSWSALRPGDVTAAVTRCGCGHRNAARHTWATAVHAGGKGMWRLRTLLGQGRGAAAAGSFYTTWSPSVLLVDLRARMDEVAARWALPPFGGFADAAPDLVPVDLRLDWHDKPIRRSAAPGLPRLQGCMPRHYCGLDTLPALRVVDDIGDELHDADSFGRSGSVMASLIVMDGITDPADLAAMWGALQRSTTSGGMLEWTRLGSSTIRMPMQPSTRLRAGFPSALGSLELAVGELLARLREKFTLIAWPATTDGLLRALCWLMCRWVRVHVPPILIYCGDAHTRAATFTERSIERIRHPVDGRSLSIDALRRAVEPRAPRRRLDEELRTLLSTVREVALDDGPIGNDLLRSQLIASKLAERFDRMNCSAFVSMLLDWVEEECARWSRREPDPLQMSPLYEYLRLILRSVGRGFADWQPQEWTQADWRRFAVFVLDVTKAEEEGQVSQSRRAGEVQERRKAWRRLIRVLTEAGRFAAARGSMSLGDDGEASGPEVSSASSVYCNRHHVVLAERILRVLFDESALEADVVVSLMRVGYEAEGRADECNAVRLRDVGPDYVALFGENFSTEKTPGSRRVALTTPALSALLRSVCERQRSLRPPPTHLFGQTADEIRLRHGRQREGVVVLVMRALLNEPDFLWHSFRGAGLIDRVAPGTEEALRSMLSPTFPLDAAQAIVAAFQGSDPRHQCRVFASSGHASYLSPGQSYMAVWPLWYAAAMRAARGNHALNHRLLVRRHGLSYAAAHRQRRRRSVERDEWAWVLSPDDQRMNSRRATPAPCARALCAPPSELKALAVRSGTTWSTRLRFAIEVLLGLPAEPRAWRCSISDLAAKEVVAKLGPVPSLAALHHPTPGRPAELHRQRFSAADLLKDARSKVLVSALEAASASAVTALERLLRDDMHDVDLLCVEAALQALPSGWKLELCWPRNQLDRELVARLTHLTARLAGLCERVHVTGGVRARVVPNDGANHTSITHLTTLTRAAVRAWLSIVDLEKENTT